MWQHDDCKRFFIPFTSFEELTTLRNEKITDLTFKKLLPQILGENTETENKNKHLHISPTLMMEGIVTAQRQYV